MLASDQFSTHYAQFLEGTYDCVDRIILNGSYSLGFNPGGFRTWWRRLYGHDDNLNNSTLQRLSGRFSRRLRTYAKKHNIPIIYTNGKSEKKHTIAERYQPDDPEFCGLFLVIVGRARGFVWDVIRNERGQISEIKRKNSQTYVNHFSFHIIDPDWGHVTFKICGQPPFAAQIMLNGHEYVARQAQKNDVPFTKVANCFTSFPSGPELATIAETLCSPSAVGQLTRLCDRWIYSSCLHFALSMEEVRRTHFSYSYSVYQIEYSRNLLFHRGSEMERVVQAMIDGTRSSLDINTVKTLFGYKNRPKLHRKGNKRNRFEVVLERPVYDLTVFNLNFGRLSLKVYTKGERLLRIEVVAHNVKALRCRRSLPFWVEIVSLIGGMLKRFLDVLACVDTSSISSDIWDELPQPSCVGSTRTPGINLSNPRLRAAIEAVISLAAAPDGFSVRDLTDRVRRVAAFSENSYSTWNAAYDLRKIRGKGFVEKVPQSHRYRCTTSGLQAMVAMLVITDKVVRPVLAGAGKPRPGRPRKLNAVDIHYKNLRREMHNLFDTLRIAA